AEIAVGAPVLGELHGGPGQLPRILLELAFEPLEQGKGVGGGAGEAADDVALAKLADLLGVGLDDGLADRDLAVAADHHLAALADRQDRRAVPDRRLMGGCLHGYLAFPPDLGVWANGYNQAGRGRIPVTIGRTSVIKGGLPR